MEETSSEVRVLYYITDSEITVDDVINFTVIELICRFVTMVY
jgi:hypothetical protein